MLNLRLLQSEDEYPLDKVRLQQDENRNYFILESSKDSNIRITVPYILPLYNDYLPDKFDCIPFISPIHFKEENIYEVHVNISSIGRIGWIFPIQALSSDQHSYAGNEHFLKYAFITFHKLLYGHFFEHDVIVEVSSLNEEISISNIYNTEIIALSTSRNVTNKIVDFDISNYFHSLYKANYFFCQNENEVKNLNKYEEETLEFNKVKISQLSPFLAKEIYIKSLFRDHLKVNNHPLVQFHLLYQIVELLINRVYDCEVDRIINSAKGKSKNSHELIQEANQLLNEQHRIKKIIDSYLTRSLTTNRDLVRSSNALLIHFNKEKQDVSDAFYQVRNIIVHDFRTVTKVDPGFILLNDINKSFESFLIEILNIYKEPNDISPYEGTPLAWLIYQMSLEKKFAGFE